MAREVQYSSNILIGNSVHLTALVKEKLVIGDSNRIVQILSQSYYGEHNILVYPDLDSFREIYTHLIKMRFQSTVYVLIFLKI